MKMKRIKMMLVALVAVSALLLSAGTASAQTMSDGASAEIFSVPVGNFVSQSEAVDLLTGQVATLKNVLVTLTPGTQAYKTAHTAMEYYDLIQAEIADGKDIPGSIVFGLNFIVQDVIDAPSEAQLLGLRTDAINMLSQ